MNHHYGSGSTDEAIRLFGEKCPRKLKKRLYGTRRGRRRFALDFIRAMTNRKLVVTVYVNRVDLRITNTGTIE